MEKNIPIRDWQKEFEAGTFNASDFDTQVKAGWYDWFCKQSSLRNKTYKMGRIIKQVKDGGKVDLDNWYVWFKNNCPLCYPLYDDFRFADMATGDIRFTIQIDCGYQRCKYAVYGRKPLPNGEWEEHFDKPMFVCENSRDLVKWLNTKWEDSTND